MSWNELSLKDKADYIKESVNNGIYNLSDIRNRYNMYANGGYKPSESIKKRITNWEGSSMRTNRSFQAEANDFNRVIPSSIRSKLSQQQLDALYSYGYNVGMGNLKKRVLPTLTNYVQGKASNEDVQKSMWASKDNELRGLTTRRNIERSLFGGKYQTVFTGTGGTPHNYGYTTTNRSSSNPYKIQNEEWQGKNYLGAYKGLQLSMNDIMGKTKETDIDDLFSTGTGPIISMENLMSIGNNNVAPVQPDYSYAKSLLSDFDSDLNSNMFGNGGKIPRTYQGNLSNLKDVGYQKWRAHLPTNLREETSDYNLYEAYKSGAKPRLESDGFYHLPSRDPRTNKILKKATHPTYGMALREDAIEGYLPVYNNGETYTYPLPWIKAYGGKINMLDEGGNLSFIDADNRRSNILLHTEDGNLYDSAGNNYTQSYLDEENVPIIKGTMPRNTRQYYDPNTTLEFINAATAPISNFSPSNIVGSIREARDYDTFMNSFMNQDNTGFFTREYAEEHPYISTLGNLGGDILAGAAFDKLGDLKDTSTYRKLGYKFNKLQKKLGLVDRGDTQFFYYPNDYVSKVLEGINTRNPELLNDWTRVSGATDRDLEAFMKMYKRKAFPIPNTIEYNGQTIQLPNSWKQLFADNPEYYEFIQRTGLDPMSQETVDKFMLRQGTSLRGVTTNNPMNAQKYLTETEVGRYMKGGDRLRTNGGLYTSNSTGIADAFKNPTANKEEAGYVGTLFHDFQTDKSQPIAEQLKQYRDKVGFSNEGDIFAGTETQNVSRNKYLEDGVVALESPYGRSNGDMLRVTERAYLPLTGPKGTKGKPVEILESNFYPSQTDKKGRWNTAGVEHTLYDENYFLPRQYNSTYDFIRNARILLKKDWVPNIDKKNKVGQDIIDTYHNRANLLNELKRKSKSWKY